MKNNYLNIQTDFQEEQKRLRACKTKEDLNNLFAGRTIIVLDKSEWHNERTTFVEMVGEGAREKWKMKVKTQFGTFLELKPSHAMVVTQTIRTTKVESDKIFQALIKDGAKEAK
jgi:hypothetical protein